MSDTRLDADQLHALVWDLVVAVHILRDRLDLIAELLDVEFDHGTPEIVDTPDLSTYEPEENAP